MFRYEVTWLGGLFFCLVLGQYTLANEIETLNWICLGQNPARIETQADIWQRVKQKSYNLGCMEDRRYPRIDIDEPVGIHAGEYYKVEKGRQFSEGGMLFESDRDFSEGQMIAMTFKLSDTVLIRLDGQISYTVKPVPGKRLIGVRFLGPDNDHVKVLLEYFKKRGSC